MFRRVEGRLIGFRWAVEIRPAALAGPLAPWASGSRRVPFAVAHRRGLAMDDLRAVAGGSLARLSRRQASELILRVGGGPLSHPPGQEPRPRRRPAPPAGVVCMITVDQIGRIARLILDYFGSEHAAYDWLKKYRQVDTIRDLGSARKAGHVIGVPKP